MKITTSVPAHRQPCAPRLLALMVCGGAMPLLQAAELVNNDNYQIRWDNTLKYQVGMRTEKPSSRNLNNLNANDGTGAFERNELITNRVDILTEFDLTLKDAANSGLRISAAGWYDNVYDRDHNSITEATYNQSSVSNHDFTNDAKVQAGRNIELLDAFVHSSFDVAGHNLSWRLGRHTLLWGESLFLATNGIATGQAPNDAYKALSVPSTLAKEVFMPVNQFSMALELTENLSFEGYYQLEYRETRVPAPGTYWSTFDAGFKGGENLLLAPSFRLPRGDHDEPSDTRGQWGVALKYRDYENDMDYGMYYLRYTTKTPQVIVHLAPTFVPDEYYFKYPDDIEIYGLSLSSKIGNANVAGEISFRDNMPLVSGPLSVIGNQPDDIYAVGQTLHAQISAIWVLPRVSWYDNAQIVGELGANHLYKVTKNDEARDKDTVRTAAGFRVQFEPTWYQALPSIDLSAPVTLGYNFTGRSAVDPGFNITGAAHGGDIGASLNFKYAGNLRGGINYTHYLGDEKNNPYHDRDFVLLNVAYSF
ncbi:DUF1302 domain-containing protein [Pseudomonas ogarae]|uniref:Protoheme IX farnesyltransferase n=1 Tax=Pseudomonas ogarae (strain DSM 112162 / CECT 30235 / F113) TaxID=1114970 RepID=A0ABM6QZ22_PSEO1|nr:DUF1302 domain-containing protein [Pseudomonas ogarae]AEV62589.1 Hypothetical protein PSF113_2582 [Pseudomonas ogarae]AUO46496.1 protoheme IX farnesyltransferase [Pseudomonas ogarae]